MKTKPNSTLRLLHTARAALLALALTAAWHTPAHGQIIQQWLTQWGSSSYDYANGVAVDAAGTTWVTGQTGGSWGGTSMGGWDIFLTPLSATGVRGTSVQRGGTADDIAFGAAVVGGNTVFAVGQTISLTTWDGAPALGSYDAVAVRYSTAGAWLGTTRMGSSLDDYAYAAAGNATHLLIVGSGQGTIDGQAQIGAGDARISKRDSTGALVWTRVVGSSNPDAGLGAAFDSAGNAYMAGDTYGSLPTFTNAGGHDLFVTRFDASGNRTLLKQWGTSADDYATDVEVDVSGNIYVTGYTQGALAGEANHGNYDAFLTKLNSSGNVLWTRLLGGTGLDTATGLALDAAGRVWVGGYSNSLTMAGHTNANPNSGTYDAFVMSYNSAGTLLGTAFWGTTGDDYITGLAAAPDGGVRVTGYTDGTLGAANFGGYDPFAISLTMAPEPTSAALLLGGGALLALRRRRNPAGV